MAELGGADRRLLRVTPEQLALAIRSALQDAVDAGELRVDVPDLVRVERPRNRDHGDWSTNIAMRLAKRLGTNPRELAQRIADDLARTAGIDAVEVAAALAVIAQNGRPFLVEDLPELPQRKRDRDRRDGDGPRNRRSPGDEAGE